MLDERIINLNDLLQDLIDALQFTKTTPQYVVIAESLEVRLYAAHDQLIARFAAVRQTEENAVVGLPDATLIEFDAVRCDILHHAQCWLDEQRPSDDDW